jgi:hypothetical protein
MNYIDDLIAAGVDVGDAIARIAAAGPLALHALGRPLSDSESIPRDDILSLKKFAAEALPEETKAVLGWLIDAWSLTVWLPLDKHIAWSRSIQSVLDTRKISYPSHEELQQARVAVKWSRRRTTTIPSKRRTYAVC